MDNNAALVQGLVSTVKNAYHDANCDDWSNVEYILQTLYDKALVDADSKEALLFNRVFISCDEYVVCSPSVRLEYAKRVVTAVSECDTYLYNETPDPSPEELKIIRSKALEIVTKTIQEADDNTSDIELWYEYIRDNTSDKATQNVMDNRRYHDSINSWVSEYFQLAIELLQQYLKTVHKL